MRTVQLPDFGPTGTQRVMAFEFTYADTSGATLALTTIPAGTHLKKISVKVPTGEEFDSGTSDKLEIGHAKTVADPNYFSPDTEADLTTAGPRMAELAGAGTGGVPYVFEEDTPLTMEYTAVGTAATQGRAIVIFEYAPLNE